MKLKLVEIVYDVRQTVPPELREKPREREIWRGEATVEEMQTAEWQKEHGIVVKESTARYAYHYAVVEGSRVVAQTYLGQ